MENKEPVSGTLSSPQLISDDTINFYKSPGLTKPLDYRPYRLCCVGTGSQIPPVRVHLMQDIKAPTPEGSEQVRKQRDHGSGKHTVRQEVASPGRAGQWHR